MRFFVIILPRAQVQKKRRSLMSLHTLLVLAALVAGVLILVMPKMLHYIVAAWLILYGIIGFVR
jgi:hypothetical protein